MRAEQIRFSNCGKNGKKRFGAADFVAEKFKRVRQRVANRKTKRAQPKSIQENVHLMSHPHRAVLQVAVIKAEAGIEEDFFHAAFLSQLNLSPKKI